MCGSLTKDFHKLMKSIGSFSNNQAEVCHFEENLDAFKVEIIPNDGVYSGGKFNFQVSLKDYPKAAPSVRCETRIYHPNIDNESGDICLNLLDEWTETHNLEDCVQGLLFLFYNPNLEDPLSPLFDPDCDNNFDEFTEKVRRSLEGGEVEGCRFERNLVTEHSVTDREDKSINCEGQNDAKVFDAELSGCEVVNETNDTIACHELNRTAVTGNVDSNLNTKSSDETGDFILGKVHPHRTEEHTAGPMKDENQ